MRRPSASALLSWLAVGGASLFVFVQLRPDLLFADTTAAGGDMGAHVWGPDYLRDHLLPKGRLSGWAPDWYAGFPWLTFYFPLPSLLVVAGDLFLPYNVAFKLVTTLGLVSLPVSAWAFGRLSGLPRPGPGCLGVAALLFIFDTHYDQQIYGGTVASTLAGEFAFSISLSLTLLFLGVLALSLRTGHHRALAAVLLALTALSHVIVTVFAVVAGAVVAAFQPGRRRLVHAGVVAVLGGLIAAFWALPLVVRLPYSNDMGWEKLVEYGRLLFPAELRWVVGLAVAGVVVSAFRRCRTGAALATLAVVTGLAFRFAPETRLWNGRLLPFWFLSLYLLAGVAVASLPHAVAWLLGAERSRGERAGVMAMPVLALLAAVTFLDSTLGVRWWPSPFQPEQRPFLPDWVRWNYAGYEDEGKPRRQEYFELVRTMEELGRTRGCGRAMWEYEFELNDMGTPMALMLLPYWTDGCVGSMEGLYFESSATTPYHFLVQSELSAAPSRAQRDLPYGPLDVAAGVEHLKRLGVRYYMAISPQAQAQARGVPDLRLVATSGPWRVRYQEELQERTWEIYEVSGSELVSPLENEPVVLEGVDHGRGWLDAAAKWHQDPSLADVVLVADGPDDWRRIQAPEVRGPTLPVRPATVGAIRVEDDRISFDVDRPGSPVLVKASYFPNWKATGADGPWRATPNLMVVLPTERHVELNYGTTPVDRIGWALTLTGSAATVVVARRRPVDEDGPGTEEPAAGDEDVDRELSEVLAVPAVVTGTDERL